MIIFFYFKACHGCKRLGWDSTFCSVRFLGPQRFRRSMFTLHNDVQGPIFVLAGGDF